MAKSAPRGAVTVSLHDLIDSSVSFETLEEAFGPSSLGILIVKDLPSNYINLRARLLSYASYLAQLPESRLEALTCPSAKFLTGWSHGKEALKPCVYDTMKGSFYVNCAFYNDGRRLNHSNHDDSSQESHNPPPSLASPNDPAQNSAPIDSSSSFPEFSIPNVWPPEPTLPGFQETFEALCTIVIDTAALVARACDRYASTHIADYPSGYLERVVQTSTTTKARLLHYFPPGATDTETQGKAHVDEDGDGDGDEHGDEWCATHIDHGCLTGLTSAAYIDESHLQPLSPSSIPKTLPFLPLPSGSGNSGPGLYIHARDDSITKIAIPADALAFQTGETLQLITKGKFRAVPHFVRSPRGNGRGDGKGNGRIARNTLAVFTQPNLDEVVDGERGLTFAGFSREVSERFG